MGTDFREWKRHCLTISRNDNVRPFRVNLQMKLYENVEEYGASWPPCVQILQVWRKYGIVWRLLWGCWETKFFGFEDRRNSFALEMDMLAPSWYLIWIQFSLTNFEVWEPWRWIKLQGRAHIDRSKKHVCFHLVKYWCKWVDYIKSDSNIS